MFKNKLMMPLHILGWVIKAGGEGLQDYTIPQPLSHPHHGRLPPDHLKVSRVLYTQTHLYRPSLCKYPTHRCLPTNNLKVRTPHADVFLSTISNSNLHHTPPISKWEPHTKTHFTVQRHLPSNHLRFICVQRYLTLNQPDQHKFSYQVLVILILQVW